jgi:FtsH-binding integral membrane protein
MANYENYSSRGRSTARNSTGLMTRVFGWQSLGLMISAVVAFIVATTPLLFKALVMNKILFYGLMFGQLGLVMALGFMAHKMSYSTMVTAYVGYALMTGITLSTIFMVYTMSSIAGCFGIAAGMFGVMAAYGYVTKSDLSGFGNIMLMGLIGVLIASLVNMFMRSDTMSYVLSFLSIIIFTGLTAYDVQKIKHFSSAAVDEEMISKVAILGALTLYLDFLNIFLHLLFLLGGRRRS